MIDCPHGIHGVCAIASGLCNRPVPLDNAACITCSNQVVAFGKNSVTASLAIKYRNQKEPIDRYLVDLAANRAHLAGHILERYIHRWLKRLRITAPSECNCKKWIADMNEWGVDESLRRADEIAAHLHESLNTVQLPSFITMMLTRSILRRIIVSCLSKKHS